MRAGTRWYLRQLRCRVRGHRWAFWDGDGPKVLPCARCMRPILVEPWGPRAMARALREAFSAAAYFEPAERSVSPFFAALEQS